MKKFLLLSLLALFGAASARADSRAEYVTRIETCEAILQQFMANPATAIPARPTVLTKSRRVNSVPSVFLLMVGTS